MKKAIGVLTLLAIVAVATAEVEVRIWLTTASPAKADGGPINFRATYGPFSPFLVKDNGTPESGPRPYDVHRNHIATSNPGSVLRYQSTPTVIEKFDPTLIPDVVEPGVGTGGIEEGKPVYIWAAFCGPGMGEDPETGDPMPLDPIKPGLGWENAGVRVQGMQIALVTTGSLAIQPHWYQYEAFDPSKPPAEQVTELRWAETSDMTGDMVTLVGLGTGSPAATGWYAGVTGERMQTWKLDYELGNPYGLGTFGAGGILLGAITATGGGDLYVGLQYNGINTTAGVGSVYYAGSEAAGINADKVDEGSPVRHGTTPEATWIPEPASLLLLSLGLLALRRR